MSWCDYVKSLMSDSNCQDAAIVGYQNTPCVWAAHEGGILGKVTAAEVKSIISSDRSIIFINGLIIAGMSTSVIRDQLFDPESHTMDLKTKNQGGASLSIVIAKSRQTLVIMIGKEGAHCGSIHSRAHSMAKYLSDSGY